jgi:hypothetical protein
MAIFLAGIAIIYQQPTSGGRKKRHGMGCFFPVRRTVDGKRAGNPQDSRPEGVAGAETA